MNFMLCIYLCEILMYILRLHFKLQSCSSNWRNSSDKYHVQKKSLLLDAHQTGEYLVCQLLYTQNIYRKILRQQLWDGGSLLPLVRSFGKQSLLLDFFFVILVLSIIFKLSEIFKKKLNYAFVSIIPSSFFQLQIVDAARLITTCI